MACGIHALGMVNARAVKRLLWIDWQRFWCHNCRGSCEACLIGLSGMPEANQAFNELQSVLLRLGPNKMYWMLFCPKFTS